MIHFANFVGCVFYQERRGSYFLSGIQSAHLQLALDALGTMREEDDPFSLAQANFFMGMAYGHTQVIASAKQYLMRAVQITRRHNIRFVPMSEEGSPHSPPEFTEEVHERVAFLAHMLHLETAMYLVDKPPSAPPGVNFEEHIEYQLPVSASLLLFLPSSQPLRAEIVL